MEYAGAVVNNWITEKTGDAAVTYYEGTGDTDYPENENAPVNAGTYKFVVKIADVTAYAEFEIQRLDQNVEFDVIDYTFGDSVEAPAVTGAQEDPVIEYYYTTVHPQHGWNIVGELQIGRSGHILYVCQGLCYNQLQ